MWFLFLFLRKNADPLVPVDDFVILCEPVPVLRYLPTCEFFKIIFSGATTDMKKLAAAETSQDSFSGRFLRKSFKDTVLVLTR